MDDMSSFIKKIQNTIFQQNLFKRNDRIILAVSGGPDSVCLLDVFFKLQKKYNLSLIVAHVNYGLRGKDSAEDEKFVRKLAEKYNLRISNLTPAFVKTSTGKPDLSLNKERGQRKMPSEEKLRDVRYDFFEKLRVENKFDYIAVAHNADDQVETFLMRIIRGAGLQGLSAMKYKNNSRRIVRPLLGITRKEILAYLKINKLKYRIDKTNLESVFLRNKIRNKLIPYLEKSYNPNIKKTIFDSIVSIAEDYDFINTLAEKAYQKNKELSAKKILSLHPAMQRRVLQKIISEKKFADRQNENVEFAHVEEVLKALKSTKGKNQTVSFAGLKMIRKGDKISLS